MNRGFGKNEVLLAIIVMAVFGGLMFFLLGHQKDRQSTGREATRMRQLFLALTFYETDNFGGIAPNLLAARYQVADDSNYLSERDPYRAARGPFPLEPGIPSVSLVSPVRISDSYLWNFVAAKAVAKPKNSIDPTVGLIASDWAGSVTPTSAFGAQVAGRVSRVNMDGAFTTILAPARTVGEPNALFLKLR